MPFNRRKFIKQSLLFPAAAITAHSILGNELDFDLVPEPFKRVRPGEAGWPSAQDWDELNKAVSGNLIKIDPPLGSCKANPNSAECTQFFKDIKNPFLIGDSPALTQTSGWLDAWSSSPSAYAVAAKSSADVVAAVNFAREHKLRLVVKGGGHSYQGTSNAADSLLIWTRHMDKIEMHDQFVAEGCEAIQKAQPAVTIDAGVIWIRAYNEVTTRHGRYVQGGGCATVGVAGLIQSGGFGSFSKKYGLAAAGLLQAEIVTADGKLRTVNACQDPELFWALKGGGGGSFGVVTKLTLRTRELPAYFGAALGVIKANSREAYKKLLAKTISFYKENLFNEHWGEQIRFYADNTLHIQMLFQGLTKEEAEATWQPFQQWVAGNPADYSWNSPSSIIALPAQHLWDPAFLRAHAPEVIVSDTRPGASPTNICWAGDINECGQVLQAYHSAWMPATLLEIENQSKLAEALFEASRHWTVSFHFNKGLAGAPEEERMAVKETATNPQVADAFALAIVACESQPAFVGITGHQPDVQSGRIKAEKVSAAMAELTNIAPNAGSYLSESNFFDNDWKKSFWGPNFKRLAAAKKKYDPQGLFFVHHGVGSDEWSEDGFEKL